MNPRSPRHDKKVSTLLETDFENFELTAEVKTKPGTNSGIYFHTAWQETNWPSQGFADP